MKKSIKSYLAVHKVLYFN